LTGSEFFGSRPEDAEVGRWLPAADPADGLEATVAPGLGAAEVHAATANKMPVAQAIALRPYPRRADSASSFTDAG